MRDEVAGLPALGADGEMATDLAGQGFEKVGAEGQVLAELAVIAQFAVAGGDHHAAFVQHEHRQAAQVGVQAAQVVVDTADTQRVAGLQQQRLHVLVELDRGGHVFQPLDHALDGGGEQVEPVVRLVAQRQRAVLLADPESAPPGQPDGEPGQHDAEQPAQRRPDGAAGPEDARRFRVSSPVLHVDRIRSDPVNIARRCAAVPSGHWSWSARPRPGSWPSAGSGRWRPPSRTCRPAARSCAAPGHRRRGRSG